MSVVYHIIVARHDLESNALTLLISDTVDLRIKLAVAVPLVLEIGAAKLYP
jgi:hypothetical protein